MPNRRTSGGLALGAMGRYGGAAGVRHADLESSAILAGSSRHRSHRRSDGTSRSGRYLAAPGTGNATDHQPHRQHPGIMKCLTPITGIMPMSGTRGCTAALGHWKVAVLRFLVEREVIDGRSAEVDVPHHWLESFWQTSRLAAVAELQALVVACEGAACK
jgi:hypothetical protein